MSEYDRESELVVEEGGDGASVPESESLDLSCTRHLTPPTTPAAAAPSRIVFC